MTNPTNPEITEEQIQALLDTRVRKDGLTFEEVLDNWNWDDTEKSIDIKDVAKTILLGLAGNVVYPPGSEPDEPALTFAELFVEPRKPLPAEPNVFPVSEFTDAVAEEFKDDVSRVNIGIPEQ